MSKDAQCFLSSWRQSPLNPNPYPHYLLHGVFPRNLLTQLQKLPFTAYDLDYLVGAREEFNPFRQYISPEVIQAHDCSKRVADLFLSPSITSFIEENGQISLQDSLLRLEFALDKDKFWLKPHTDIGVKLFTMLIYISNNEEGHDWGTDIYRDESTHHSTIPYLENSALVFFPSDKTWHGFEPRTIRGVRKTIIVNYVTQEWRNRNELVHPTKTIAELQAEKSAA